jgi:hypothetical protein
LDRLDHPRDAIDLVCVADLNSWASTLRIRPTDQGLPVEVGYFKPSLVGDETVPDGIGAALANLYQRLGQTDPTLRSLADHFRLAELKGHFRGYLKGRWPLSVLSDEVQAQVLTMRPAPPFDYWDEWSFVQDDPAPVTRSP